MRDSDSSQQITIGEAFLRARPWATALGLLVLAIAFGVAAYAIFQDYELRVRHMWNGIVGTHAGIVAHQKNVAAAKHAEGVAAWITAFLGLTLIIPRHEEPAWLRLLGWIGFLFAVVMGIIALAGLAGASFHYVLVSFDASCPLDGPCNHAPRAMRPEDWLISYGSQLGFAASAISATLSASIGIRWLIWASRALFRRAAPHAHGINL